MCMEKLMDYWVIFMEKTMEIDWLLSDFPWIFIGSSDFSMDDGGYWWELPRSPCESCLRLQADGETGRLGGDHWGPSPQTESCKILRIELVNG